jgi:hypothetical protein
MTVLLPIFPIGPYWAPLFTCPSDPMTTFLATYLFNQGTAESMHAALKMEAAFLPKCWYPLTRLHGLTTQKASI